MLMPVLLAILVSGCGHTRSHQQHVSRYVDITAPDGEDGTFASSSESNNLRQTKKDRARQTKLEVLATALDLTERSLADSVATRRCRPGVKHDLNDELEAYLYSAGVRLAVKTLRALIFERYEQ
jgi:hypothetical protein